MARKRSLFKMIFGRDDQPSKTGYTQFKLLSSTTSTFSSFDGNIYNNDIVRSCIRPKTNAVGKLHPIHIRTDIKTGERKYSPNPSIKMLLRFPNQYMSMQKLLEKMMNQRELTNNAYAYIRKDALGNPLSIFPIPTTKVELLEKSEEVFAQFTFRNGKQMTVPYCDVIHLRKDFNDSDFYGSDCSTVLNNVMGVIDTTDKGIIKSIKNSNIIKWLMKFKQVLRPEDKEMAVQEFTDNYLDIEKAEAGNVATTDPRYDLEQVKEDNFVPNGDVIAKYETRLKNYFGVSDKIIQNNYTEDEWNAFYESEIEPIATELSDQLTFKLFTKHELECGNEIIFEASSLEFTSPKTKLNLKEMVDRGAMNVNEWRKVMNLPSTENGDEFIRRLDTAPVDNKLKKEGENDGKEE